MTSWSYAVLADVSICYPPVWDRLLTRYSPVRRWNINLPAETFQSISPLDLHVLSTPPSFDLSQDQTLMFNPYLVSFQLPNRLAKANPSSSFNKRLTHSNLTVSCTVCLPLSVSFSRIVPPLSTFHRRSRQHMGLYHIPSPLVNPIFRLFLFLYTFGVFRRIWGGL